MVATSEYNSAAIVPTATRVFMSAARRFTLAQART